MLQDQHGIAKGIETIAFFYRSFVCFQNFLPSGKGADQHDERGLGQMEVGDHGVLEGELVAGENVDGGGAGIRDDD